jgi:hypothetical protein
VPTNSDKIKKQEGNKFMTFIKNNIRKFITLVFALLLSLSLAACKKDDAQTVSEALASIAVGNLTNVKISFTVRATTIQHDLPITWEIECTDGSAVLETAEGVTTVVVTRSEYTEDAQGVQTNPWGEAVLKATVTVNNTSSTRTWDLSVAPGEKVAETTIDIAAVQVAAEGTLVLVQGAVTYVMSQGFYIQDETAGIYVYLEATPEAFVVPGAIVKVAGTFDIFYTTPEIITPTVTKITDAPVAGFDYSDAPVGDIETIIAKSKNDTTSHGEMYKVTGLVVANDPNTISDYSIKDTINNVSLYIYNSSNSEVKAELLEKVGEYVTIVVITHDYHSEFLVWRFLGVKGTVVDAEEPVVTDQEIVDNTQTELTTKYEGKSYAFNLNLLATADTGAAVTWVSNTPAVIANDGTFTMPLVDTAVVLTATVTSGEVIETIDLHVTAKAVAKQTIAQVITALDAAAQLGNPVDFVMFEGIIIGADTDGYYYVADSEAILYVRHKLSADSLAVGDSVQIIGKAAVYTNTNTQYSRQISGNYKVVKLDELTHDCPIAAVDALISDFDFTITADNFLTAVSAEAFYGKLVKFDLYVTLQGTYNDVYLAESMTAGAPKILIYYKSLGIDGLETLAGTKVKVTAVVCDYSISSGWRLGFLDREGDIEVPVNLTEAEKLAFAAAEIEGIVKEGDEVSGNLGFITDTAIITIPGVKYTWTTDDLTAITAAGVFTAPAADKTVKITVNCFLDGNIAGTPSATWDINVTAKAPVPLVVAGSIIISQAYGGGGNTGATYTNDFVELYNTTDAAIDLTGVVLFYASKTGLFKLPTDDGVNYPVLIQLTGTIEAHGYYLIQCAAGTGGTLALPTPDATCGIAMGGTGFKLALCNTIDRPVNASSANIIDFVGTVGANFFEGAETAPEPSNTTAIVRATLTDTNNNGADFTIAAPNPRS